MRLIAMVISIAVCANPGEITTLCAGPVDSPTAVSGLIQHAASGDEESSYLAALRIEDPAARAAALDVFVSRYPNSELKTDALDQEMIAYHRSGNLPDEQKTAERILIEKPDDVLALAAMASAERTEGASIHREADRDYAGRGLRALSSWRQPKGMSDNTFRQLRNETTAVLYGSAGFAALQAKDFSSARNYYLHAIELNPSDFMNVYQLGVADLEMRPVDLNGLWYVAKAASLIPSNYLTAREGMLKYGRMKNRLYKGTDRTWDYIVSSSAGQTSPPPDFVTELRRHH